MSDETRKLSFRVSGRVADEIDEYAELAGMTRSAFMNIAVVIGMRTLARQIAPERFVTPELAQMLQGAGFGLPDTDSGNQGVLDEFKG